MAVAKTDHHINSLLNFKFYGYTVYWWSLNFGHYYIQMYLLVNTRKQITKLNSLLNLQNSCEGCSRKAHADTLLSTHIPS